MINPSYEAEQSVIGAILISPETVMPECTQILDESDFLVGEFKNVYHVCSEYFISGKAIDIVTLINKLGNEYKVILTYCAESMPTISNWKAYAEIVLTTAKRSRAYTNALDLVDSLQRDIEFDIEECQEMATKISESLSETKNDKTFSANEGFVDFYVSLQNDPEYIRTGISDIDQRVYIERGDFIVIGARPSVGKTALTLQMLLTMSKTHKVVYFSLETTSRKLFGRMSSAISKISMKQIKNRNIDYEKLSKSSDVFNKLNFYTVEASGWTVSQIKSKSIQLGAEIIVVDYLGLIKADGKSPYEKVTNASRDLHILALQNNMAVFAVCQLNRAGKDKPDMTHLRESGQIEQDAEIILLLHAPDGNESQEREIIVAKNKEGEVGLLDLVFDGTVQTFYELENRY